jgi:hypothetical protein
MTLVSTMRTNRQGAQRLVVLPVTLLASKGPPAAPVSVVIISRSTSPSVSQAPQEGRSQRYAHRLDDKQ